MASIVLSILLLLAFTIKYISHKLYYRERYINVIKIKRLKLVWKKIGRIWIISQFLTYFSSINNENMIVIDIFILPVVITLFFILIYMSNDRNPIQIDEHKFNLDKTIDIRDKKIKKLLK